MIRIRKLPGPPGRSDCRPWLLPIVLLLALAFVRAGSETLAQDQQNGWTIPVNLSHGGAASSPVILAQPDGSLRAFWWDRFDGLTLAEGTGVTVTVWSEPQPVPILVPQPPEPGVPATVEPIPIGSMPRLVSDSSGTVHAFWLGEPDEETRAQPLLHARLPSGETDWSTPTTVAPSTVGFDVIADVTGTLHLAYITAVEQATAAAGVYYRSSDNNGQSWRRAEPIDQSRYLRLLTPETAWVRLAADGASGLHVTWDDPNLEQSVLVTSSDGGATWTAPQAIGDAKERSQRGRVVPVPAGETLLLWEAEPSEGACSLFQAPVAELLAETSSAGQQVLEELTACPQNERFVPVGDAQVLMMAGSGSDTLTLAAWNGEEWSKPTQLSFSFEDPELGRQVYLSELQAALTEPSSSQGEGPASGTLVIAGTDQAGDVWAAGSQVSALELVFAPPPPWSTPESFSGDEMVPSLPAVAADAEGRLHVLWSEASDRAEPGTVLLYARWDGARWTDPTNVLQSAEGKADQPALTVVGDRLHAAWISGQNSGVSYSSAFTSDAHTAAGWSEPQCLPGPLAAKSWPEIEADADGVLHVVYAVPLNEGRGIYYTRSEDGGENWSEARQVFDAAAAGWAMADYPRLAVDIQGLLHVAWVRAALPGSGPAGGVYYARSLDGGETWTEAVAVVEGAHAWPLVAVSAPGQVQVLWNEANGQRAWWYRGSADGGETWTRPERVPGFGTVPGPAGLIAEGNGALHLVGLGQEDNGEWALRYATWDGDRWSLPEMFPLNLEKVEPGVTAGLLPALRRLEVIFRAELEGEVGTTQLGLWHTGRLVPTVAVTPVPTFVPRPAVTLSPTPVLAPDPTSAPGLSSAPTPTAGGSLPLPLPLLLAGGLAVLIVAGVLGMRLLRIGRR
jgi:hypothetical protein